MAMASPRLPHRSAGNGIREKAYTITQQPHTMSSLMIATKPETGYE